MAAACPALISVESPVVFFNSSHIFRRSEQVKRLLNTSFEKHCTGLGLAPCTGSHKLIGLYYKIIALKC